MTQNLPNKTFIYQTLIMNYNFPSNQNPLHFLLPSFSQHLPMLILPNTSQSTPNYLQLSLQNQNIGNILHYQQALCLHRIRTLQEFCQFTQYHPLKGVKKLSKALELPNKEISSIQWTEETTPKIEETSTEMESEENERVSSIKSEENIECIVETGKPYSIEDRVEQMLSFFLRNFSETKLEEFKKQRRKYEYDESFKDLLDVFDVLVKKYTSASKCREDMIRFIMRKAITTTRDLYKEEHKVLAKEALLALCEKYFPEKYKKLIEELGNSEEAQEKIVQLIFPYKRESVNRTANSRYVQEIFSSDEFYQDFLKFYERFDDIMKRECEEKSKKFIHLICKCVKENNFNSIQKFKRLPWLDSWNKATKTLGEDLKATKGKNLTIRRARGLKNKKIKK